MKKLLLGLLLLCSVAALGQAWVPPVCSTGSVGPVGCIPVVSVSGTAIKVTNPYLGYNASFEEIFSGSPASVSVTIVGCMSSGTCDTAADTNTSSASQIRFVTFSKAYTYFLVTPTFSGGTSPTFKVYPAVTTARTGNGALVNATLDLPNPVTGQTGIFQYKVQSNGLVTRVSCSTDQGTATINLDLRTEAAPNASGTPALGSNLVCSSNTTVTTTVSVPQYLANQPVALLITAVSGSPSILRVHVASISN